MRCTFPCRARPCRIPVSMLRTALRRARCSLRNTCSCPGSLTGVATTCWQDSRCGPLSSTTIQSDKPGTPSCSRQSSRGRRSTGLRRRTRLGTRRVPCTRSCFFRLRRKNRARTGCKIPLSRRTRACSRSRRCCRILKARTSWWGTCRPGRLRKTLRGRRVCTGSAPTRAGTWFRLDTGASGCPRRSRNSCDIWRMGCIHWRPQSGRSIPGRKSSRFEVKHLAASLC